jgi:hypothetical protein
MHHTANDHDAHDTRFPDHRPPRRALKNRFDQALLKSLDLDARRAQAGDSDDGRFADMEQRAGRQTQQIQMPRRYVFAEIAGANTKTLGVDLVEQFGLHEMDLAEIRPVGIFLGVINVLHGDAAMRVALNAKALEQRDAGVGLLGEGVGAVSEDAQDGWNCAQGNRFTGPRPQRILGPANCRSVHGLPVQRPPRSFRPDMNFWQAPNAFPDDAKRSSGFPGVKAGSRNSVGEKAVTLIVTKE